MERTDIVGSFLTAFSDITRTVACKPSLSKARLLIGVSGVVAAGPAAFIASAALRPFEEIYRQADLHYRLHWAARNARLTGAEFPVTEGFIRERRKALDWVIGVEPDWDEIPSDT